MPAPLTPLVGRDTELARVAELLAGPARLVTLVGPGGVGKTRLAIESAHACPLPALFVELAPVSSPAEVMPTIAAALGLRDGGARPVERTVRDYLGSSPMLLVIDNVEHVAAAATDLATLLTHCAGARMLATSRGPLQVPGEHLVPVEPLPVPDPRMLPASAELARIPSVRLLVERISALLPDFELDDATARTIAELCVTLEGLPLAIELAAPQIRQWGLDEVLARSRHRFELLRSPNRAVPERHRSLESALRWSVDRLASGTREVFATLSVLRGTWTVDAARFVGGRGADDALVDLVGNSLLGTVTGPGGTRFRMLESVRELAARQLAASDGGPAARRGHAEWAGRCAERIGRSFTGPDEAQLLDLADAEHACLRAALAGAGPADPVGLRTAVALTWFWDVRGHLQEGRSHLERLLSVPIADPLLSALGHEALGRLATYQGDHATAERATATAAAAFEAQGDNALLGWTLATLAWSTFFRGDLDGAQRHTAAAMRAALAAPDSNRNGSGIGAHEALGRAGIARFVVCTASGRPTEAAARYAEASAILRPGSATWAAGRTAYFAGWAAFRTGDLAVAERHERTAAQILRSIGDHRSLADCLDVLGCCAGRTGAVDHALHRFTVAATIRARSGVRRHAYLDADVVPAEAAARHSLGPAAAPAVLARGSDLAAVFAEPEPPDGPAGLTGRELEIARHVAQGWTNRRIARALGIGERTVERHLDHVRGKLGVGTRTGVAAWVLAGSTDTAGAPPAVDSRT